MAIRCGGGGGDGMVPPLQRTRGGISTCLAPPLRRIRGGSSAAFIVAQPRRIRGSGGAACLVVPPLRTIGGGGGGGSACLVPPQYRIRGGGAECSAATAAGKRGPLLFHRVPSLPFSRPPWALHCLPGPRREEHLVSNVKRNSEAWEALKAMITDMFRPLMRNLAEIRSLSSIYDLEDYQLGMLFGVVLGCVGCYRLWKEAPSVFIDVILACVFYKLSVVSREVHRQGKCNDLFARLKFGIVVIMAVKDFRKNYELLDIVRMPVFTLYLCTFVFDVACVKKYARHYLILTVNLLKTKGGLQELFKIMFYPGYISPYDDCFHRK